MKYKSKFFLIMKKVNRYKALAYDLGALHTKVIKKIFICLTESQQIGNNKVILRLAFNYDDRRLLLD